MVAMSPPPATQNGSLIGSAGNDTVSGTSGNDVINLLFGNGPGGMDVAYGGGGDDYIISDGNDSVYGGSGTDTVDLRLAGTSVDYIINIAAELLQTDTTGGLYDIGDGHTRIGSIETLVFHGGSGNDSIVGGANGDYIDGSSGKDSLYGAGGDDKIFGHNGNSILDGGTGNDLIVIDGKVGSIDGGAGYDRVVITGTNGFDAQGHVADTKNVEQFFVNAGLTVSFSQQTHPQDGVNHGTPVVLGDQIIVADVKDGMGNFLGAHIIGSEFGDSILGGHGGDTLIGNKGDDFLFGADGNDSINGGVGTDHIFGGNGDDYVLVSSGPGQQPDGQIDGGAGIDTLNYNAGFAGSGVTIDISQPTTTPLGTAVTGFEMLDFDGSASGDTAHGASGNDTLNGAGGDDFLFGSTGSNILNGGAGNDTAVFEGHQADFTFTTGSAGGVIATDTVTGETDYLQSIEFVQFDNGASASHPLSDFYP